MADARFELQRQAAASPELHKLIPFPASSLRVASVSLKVPAPLRYADRRRMTGDQERFMELQIFIRGVDGGASLRQMAEQKITDALTRYDSHIQRAVARLEDETGPEKDTIDKVCALEISTRTGDVRIRETAAEFASAIDIALDRARAALSRQTGKEKRGIGGG